MNFSSGKAFSVTPGSPCANAANSATAYDPPSHMAPIRVLPTDKHCWLMTAPPIIISGTYMSFQEAVIQMNTDMHTSSYQPPVPTNLDLGPFGIG